MRKISFSDRYGFTRLVLEGTKIQYRRPYNSDERRPYKVLETVAIAQKYSDIANNTSLDMATRLNAYLKRSSAGWSNKMAVKAELMPYRIIILDRWVEHLKSITPENCIREGIIREAQGYTLPNLPLYYENPYDAYENLIIRLYGIKYWAANPLVQAYAFKLIKYGNN